MSPVKPKKQPEPIRDSDALIAKVNKRYGAGTLVRASEASRLELRRVTTGSLAFDVMLGGGWPVNKWNEIIGNESTGKTAMVLKTVAANQAADPNYEVLWVAAEDWVGDWALKLGVDDRRIVLCESNVMEEVYDIVLDALDNQLYDAVIIDSLPALVPETEDEGAMEAFAVGVGARLNNKFFRKSSKSQKRSLVELERDCLLIMINQWREKIGVMHGDPRTTPGGKGKNYSFFVRVETARDEWIEPSKGHRVGISMKARTVKNKTAPQYRTGVVDFYFEDHGSFHAGEYDLIKEIFAIARAYDVIQGGGGGIYRYGERKWKGQDPLVESLYEEPDLYQAIRKETLDLVTRKQ